MRGFAGLLITAAMAAHMAGCAPEDDALDDKLAESAQPEPDAVNTAESVQAASAPVCQREFFCAYSGPGLTGTQLLSQKGNWSGSKTGLKSVINHGKPEPGFDHVELVWHQGGECWKRCIHYLPGPGTFQFDLPGVQITSATWRGECAHGEDVSQRCCPGCQ